MSRAFVSDKEDWAYCAKAGERCLHADPERDCRKTDCPHYYRTAQLAAKTAGDRTVRRHPEAARASAAQRPGAAGSKPSAGTKPVTSESSRRTKRSKLKPPKRWGGRSG